MSDKGIDHFGQKKEKFAGRTSHLNLLFGDISAIAIDCVNAVPVGFLTRYMRFVIVATQKHIAEK